jgi:hypothetical protein
MLREGTSRSYQQSSLVLLISFASPGLRFRASVSSGVSLLDSTTSIATAISETYCRIASRAYSRLGPRGSPAAVSCLRLRHFRLRQRHAQRASAGPRVRNEPGQSVCRSATRRELTLDGVARGRSAFALVVVAGCLSPLGFGWHAEPLTCFHTRSFRTRAPAPAAQIWRSTAVRTFFECRGEYWPYQSLRACPGS